MDKTAYDVVKSRYGALTILANDTGAVTQSLLTYGEWAEHEISFLRRFVANGGTVLDVGAYIGTHTLAFARFVGPTGRVVAIEAQPDTFEVLAKNVAANAGEYIAGGAQGVVHLQNAVASCEVGHTTIPTIDVGRQSSFGSASLLHVLTNTPTVLAGNEDVRQGHACVRALTIDSLDLQNCALIKIDVEGAEDMVLRGAFQTLRRCSPFVYCECNTLAAGLKSLATLESAGYKVFAHVVDAFNKDNFLQVAENIFGNAREVALFGMPAARAADIGILETRPFELLLDIEDADGLALALLNKPQYQFEVLRQSHAAKTGGAEFLDRSDAAKLEVDRLQGENATLQSIRQALEQRIQAADEEKLALARELAQRDNDLARLQTLLGQNDRDLSELHALLAQRDSDLARLQTLLGRKDWDLSELHALLAQRDSDLARLQTLLGQNDRDLSELHALLTRRDTDIVRLIAQGAAKDSDLARINACLSNLYASKSWKVTEPLRRVSKQIRRLRGH